MADSSAPIDPSLVRQFFSVPKQSADSDFLRREIAGRMRERLALVKIAPQCVLDAGCAQGADLFLLQKDYAGAHVLGLDTSPAMLGLAREQMFASDSAMTRFARSWLPMVDSNSRRQGPGLICGDFAQLPIAVNAVDLLWSNLALHWHAQPDRVFAEWRRVLRVNGLLMFSCFGPDTFKELRAAFSELDELPHALPFVDMHDFGDMLVNVGFATPVMDMESITVTYDSVEKLLADVRAWGGNPLLTRRRGLVGRQAWARVISSFERMRQDDGRIPLTFEIIYGHAFRPISRTTASGEAIVRFGGRES